LGIEFSGQTDAGCAFAWSPERCRLAGFDMFAVFGGKRQILQRLPFA
jgi:hypothetical protein